MLKCGCSLGMKVFTERKERCSDYIAVHSLNSNVTDCICAWMKKKKAGSSWYCSRIWISFFPLPHSGHLCHDIRARENP